MVTCLVMMVVLLATCVRVCCCCYGAVEGRGKPPRMPLALITGAVLVFTVAVTVDFNLAIDRELTQAFDVEVHAQDLWTRMLYGSSKLSSAADDLKYRVDDFAATCGEPYLDSAAAAELLLWNKELALSMNETHAAVNKLPDLLIRMSTGFEGGSPLLKPVFTFPWIPAAAGCLCLVVYFLSTCHGEIGRKRLLFVYLAIGLLLLGIIALGMLGSFELYVVTAWSCVCKDPSTTAVRLAEHRSPSPSIHVNLTRYYLLGEEPSVLDVRVNQTQADVSRMMEHLHALAPAEPDEERCPDWSVKRGEKMWEANRAAEHVSEMLQVVRDDASPWLVYPVWTAGGFDTMCDKLFPIAFKWVVAQLAAAMLLGPCLLNAAGSYLHKVNVSRDVEDMQRGSLNARGRLSRRPIAAQLLEIPPSGQRQRLLSYDA